MKWKNTMPSNTSLIEWFPKCLYQELIYYFCGLRFTCPAGKCFSVYAQYFKHNLHEFVMSFMHVTYAIYLILLHFITLMVFFVVFKLWSSPCFQPPVNSSSWDSDYQPQHPSINDAQPAILHEDIKLPRYKKKTHEITTLQFYSICIR